MDIEEFYEADERRRSSEEIEFGRDWHDAAGTRYELSWVADTGELYVMREPGAPIAEDPFGDVFPRGVPLEGLAVAVVGWIPDRTRVEEVLAGWEQAMAGPDGIGWLARRLHERGVPRTAPTA